MRVCGKALPPRAALLLTFDFTSLVFVTPLLFMVPTVLRAQPLSLSTTLLSLARLMLAGLACQALFYYNELYNLQVVRQPGAVVISVLRVFGVLFFVLALACLVLPTLAPVMSRVLLFSLMLGLIAIATRIVALPRERERVLLLSAPHAATELHETILACPEWNMEVVQIVDPERLSTPTASLPTGLSDSPAGFNRIIVSDAKAQPATTLNQLLHWKMQGLHIEDAPGFYERATGRVRVETLTPDALVFSYGYENSANKRRSKRAFDLIIASFLLLLATPAIAIVSLLILLEQKGSILFIQERIGLYGKPFRIYKFRTMSPVTNSAVNSSEANGNASEALWASSETHRITPLGAFLRKYRLDELLQFVNIVRGDMSLVGPRPEQPGFCRLLAQHIPFYEQRHTVPPGLTGWAQVRYHYGSSIEESRRKLEFDLFYVKHLSTWLDCAILIETVKVVIVGRGAR